MNVIVKGGICMPGIEKSVSMGMQECERRWKRGVVIDYITKVGHRFVAFIHWGRESIWSRWIDGIDCTLPATHPLADSF